MKASTVLLISLMVLSLGIAAQAAEYDFGGETVTFSFMWDLTPQFGEGEGKAHIDWVEEQFNVDIEFIVTPGYDPIEAIISGVMAGDPKADVYFLQDPPMMKRVAREGALYPLDDVVSDDYFSSLPSMFEDYAENYGTYKGTLYGLCYVDDGLLLEGIIWNKTLFEREGLPNLYELQENDEWTWDVFEEIAVSATRDTDADGTIDQYGLADYIPVYTAISLIYSNGGRLSRNINGKEVITFDEPQAIEALQFLQKLRTVENTATDPFLPALEQFERGNAAMLTGDCVLLSRFATSMEDDYGFVFYPKGPNGTEYQSTTKRLHVFVIPATAENPGALVELTNAIWRTTSTYTDVDAFMDDRLGSFGQSVCDYESIDTFLAMLETWTAVHYWENMGGLWGTLDQAINGHASPASAMAELKPVAQTALDELLQQE